jgi:hypothetical protein
MTDLKLTGMAAFGPDHDDAALWESTTFVEELSGVQPETCPSLTFDAGGHRQSTPTQSD